MIWSILICKIKISLARKKDIYIFNNNGFKHAPNMKNIDCYMKSPRRILLEFDAMQKAIKSENNIDWYFASGNYWVVPCIWSRIKNISSIVFEMLDKWYPLPIIPRARPSLLKIRYDCERIYEWESWSTRWRQCTFAQKVFWAKQWTH